jgi:hypothetical protein
MPAGMTDELSRKNVVNFGKSQHCPGQWPRPGSMFRHNIHPLSYNPSLTNRQGLIPVDKLHFATMSEERW